MERTHTFDRWLYRGKRPNRLARVINGASARLAGADDDGAVRIWDPETGACPLTIPTHYPPHTATWVADSLAVGLGAGILVIKPRAAG